MSGLDPTSIRSFRAAASLTQAKIADLPELPKASFQKSSGPLPIRRLRLSTQYARAGCRTDYRTPAHRRRCARYG